MIPGVFPLLQVALERTCVAFPHQMGGILPIRCYKSGWAKKKRNQNKERTICSNISLKDFFISKRHWGSICPDTVFIINPELNQAPHFVNLFSHSGPTLKQFFSQMQTACKTTNDCYLSRTKRAIVHTLIYVMGFWTFFDCISCLVSKWSVRVITDIWLYLSLLF